MKLHLLIIDLAHGTLKGYIFVKGLQHIDGAPWGLKATWRTEYNYKLSKVSYLSVEHLGIILLSI